MSNEHNAFDAPTLLSNTHFPAMHVDSDEVLARGRRRVQRRRSQVLAVAVAALLVLVPGGWLVARGIDRAAPVPAGKAHHLTTGLFARSNGVGNLGNGRVSLYAPLSTGTDFASKPTTYQVTRTAAGLRVALVSGAVTVNLPQTGGGASGLFQSVEGNRSVIAVEVPSNTVAVTLLPQKNADYAGSDGSVASYLPDGTAVALIETSKHVAQTVDGVIWQRTDGGIGATTGERPAVLDQGGETFYYFARLDAFGIAGPPGSTMVRARGPAVGLAVDGDKYQLDYVIAGLYPRGVAKARLEPARRGAIVKVSHLPGTSWDLVTAKYRGPLRSAAPEIGTQIVSNYGTWDPGAGEPPAAAPAG